MKVYVQGQATVKYTFDVDVKAHLDGSLCNVYIYPRIGVGVVDWPPYYLLSHLRGQIRPLRWQQTRWRDGWMAVARSTMSTHRLD
jgi:hypothetical protein